MKNRRFLSMLLCIALVASVFTGFAVSASADDVITHVVQKNEFLYQICKSYGLDYYQCKNAIIALNGYTSETQLNRLYVGQTVKLPASNAIAATVTSSSSTTTTMSTTTTVNGVSTTTTTSSTVGGTTAASAAASYSVSYYLIPHVVTSGETLASICNSFGTSYAQYQSTILAVNGLSSANYVWAGKTIYVPSSKAPSSGSCYAVIAHKVASGETMTSICNTYGVNYTSNAKLVSGVNGGSTLNTIYVGQTIYVPVLATASSSSTSSGTSSASTSTSASTTVSQSGYQISIGAADNGSPYALVNGNSYITRAEAGTLVTIVANAYSGYAQKSISVVRTDSKASVAVTNNSFTMPDSNVTVTVTYTKGLKINKESSLYGDFYAMVGGAAVTTCNYGDKITLQFSPNAGYTVSKVEYKAVNASAYTTVDSDENFIYSFNMPNYDIKLKVTFVASEYHKLSYTLLSGSGSVVYKNENGETVTSAAKGTKITAKAKPASGWDLDLRTDDFFVINSSDVYQNTLTRVSNYEYTFTVGDKDITAEVNFLDRNSYSLKASSVTGGSISFTVKDMLTQTLKNGASSAKVGDTVYIVANPNDDYELDLEATKEQMTYAKGSPFVATDFTDNSFVMKTGDVKVIPVFKKQTTETDYHTVSLSGFDHGTAQVYTSQYKVGSYSQSVRAAEDWWVEVRCTTDANYAISQLKVYGWSKNTDVLSVFDLSSGDWEDPVWSKDSSCHVLTYKGALGNEVLKFKMPDKGVTVKAVYKQNYSTAVPISATTNNTGAFKDSSDQIKMYSNKQQISGKALVGTKITLGYNLKDDYYVKQVCYTPDGGSNWYEIFEDDGYSYTVQSTDTSLQFKVVVEQKSVTTYKVLYGSPDTTLGDYTIEEFDKANNIYTGVKLSTDVKVNDGTVVRLEITPTAGKIDRVIVDGVDVTGMLVDAGSGKYTYTFSVVGHDVTTQVDFSSKEYTVYYNKTGATFGDYTIKVGSGTEVKTNVSADHGDAVTLKITPTSGTGEVKRVTVDGSEVTDYIVSDGSGNYTYTFYVVGHDVTTQVDFVSTTTGTTAHKVSYSKTPADGSFGSYTINGSITDTTVNHGASATLTITPASGTGMIKSVTVGGTDVTGSLVPSGSGTYTYSFNVTADTATVVEFERITHTVSYTDPGSLGSYTINGSSANATVNNGDYATLNITPAAGNKIGSVIVDGSDVTGYIVSDGSGNYTYTFIVADHDVTTQVNFVGAKHTVIYTAPDAALGSYTITVGSDTKSANIDAADGDSVILSITPAAGKLIHVYVGGTDVIGSLVDTGYGVYTYTFDAPGYDVTTQVEFEKVYYNVTGKVNDKTLGDYTINEFSAAETVKVENDTKVTLEIRPVDEIGKIKYVIVDGVNVTDKIKKVSDIKYTYTFTVSDSDVTTEVAFERAECNVTYKVNDKTLGDYTINGSSADVKVENGTEVGLRIIPVSGTGKIEKVFVNGVDVTAMIVNIGNGNYKYTFTISDADLATGTLTTEVVFAAVS